MNHLAAYPVPVPGGYRAMVRLSHKAQPWPVMDGDKPAIYPTFDKAKIAAQEHVIEHINGTMRRDGVKCEAAKVAAERLFRNGRKIEVERKVRVSA